MIKQHLQQFLKEREINTVDVPGRIRSAVLVPLFCKDDELHILFTKRTDKVKTHKGHICFPGGGWETRDDTLEFTALRETEEEIGLGSEHVEIIGELDEVASLTTNYVISPYVAFITYPFEFVLNEFEAERIIEVPVSALLDEKFVYRGSELMNGDTVTSYFYDFNGDIIWGATARILAQFLEIYSQITRSMQCEAPGCTDTR